MPRHRIDIQLEALAGLIMRIAEDQPLVREHIRREQARIDGWPGGGPEVAVSSSTDLSTVERAGQRRWQLDLELAKLDADAKALIAIAAEMRGDQQRLLGHRETDVPLQRCSGKIDPTCENIASTHHDPHRGGQSVEDLCDQCWLAACPACRDRPIASPQRLVVVGGRQVPGCEACSRRQYREGITTTKEATHA